MIDIESSHTLSTKEYEYVDLGLPSHLLWAKCNVGASTPEEVGLYFQWGDTQGYTAKQVGNGESQKAFTWTDYKFFSFSKYNGADGKTTLELEDDAAHANMGDNWRMPTSDEFKELLLNTDVYLIPSDGEEIQGTALEESGSVKIEWNSEPSSNDIKGAKFYKKDDRQTFLLVPSDGGAIEGNLQGVGHSAILWTSSLFTSNIGASWAFCADASVGVGDGNRCAGFPIRGVMEQ